MKIKYKIITLLANFAFITLSLADYENYDGRVVYHQDFSSGSYKYSSWIGTDARVSNFRASDLTNANFTNANLSNADFSNTIANGFTVTQLRSAANIQGIILAENNLNGWDFASLNLTDVSFANSTIDTTDFSGATLKNTNFSNTAITSGSYIILQVISQKT